MGGRIPAAPTTLSSSPPGWQRSSRPELCDGTFYASRRGRPKQNNDLRPHKDPGATRSLLQNGRPKIAQSYPRTNRIYAVRAKSWKPVAGRVQGGRDSIFGLAFALGVIAGRSLLRCLPDLSRCQFEICFGSIEYVIHRSHPSDRAWRGDSRAIPVPAAFVAGEWATPDHAPALAPTVTHASLGVLAHLRPDSLGNSSLRRHLAHRAS